MSGVSPRLYMKSIKPSINIIGITTDNPSHSIVDVIDVIREDNKLRNDNHLMIVMYIVI